MTVVITMRVRERGERTDRLLASVAESLHRERLTPTDAGLLPIRFMDTDMTPRQCWDLVHECARSDRPGMGAVGDYWLPAGAVIRGDIHREA